MIKLTTKTQVAIKHKVGRLAPESIISCAAPTLMECPLMFATSSLEDQALPELIFIENEGVFSSPNFNQAKTAQLR